MNQRIAAVKYYYKCNGNQSLAAHCLAHEFNINPPQRRSIQSIVEKIEVIGSIANVKKSGCPKKAINVAKAEEAINRLQENPEKSIHCLFGELEVSQSSIIHIFHQKKNLDSMLTACP